MANEEQWGDEKTETVLQRLTPPIRITTASGWGVVLAIALVIFATAGVTLMGAIVLYEELHQDWAHHANHCAVQFKQWQKLQ